MPQISKHNLAMNTWLHLALVVAIRAAFLLAPVHTSALGLVGGVASQLTGLCVIDWTYYWVVLAPALEFFLPGLLWFVPVILVPLLAMILLSVDTDSEDCPFKGQPFEAVCQAQSMGRGGMLAAILSIWALSGVFGSYAFYTIFFLMVLADLTNAKWSALVRAAVVASWLAAGGMIPASHPMISISSWSASKRICYGSEQTETQPKFDDVLTAVACGF